MKIDIRNFFLQSILNEREYMKIHSRYFSEKFKKLYELDDKINQDGYIYCVIKKGMYGLKQAAILAYNQLKNNLDRYGYSPDDSTSGIWKHQTRRLCFALCVDDFGVKYHNKEDVQHLIDSLRKHYEISIEWTGANYCGAKLTWNYDQAYVDMHMPGYIINALI